jgi:hypothetical protein
MLSSDVVNLLEAMLPNFPAEPEGLQLFLSLRRHRYIKVERRTHCCPTSTPTVHCLACVFFVLCLFRQITITMLSCASDASIGSLLSLSQASHYKDSGLPLYNVFVYRCV